ncbi:MAG TPA: hypothetical protein VK453_25830 [Micromonosporaceae bacterium]|nr:hypothetical protein [Micromonosporaceae bacterium]
MSYYVVKVYGLVCDNCNASQEHVPRIDQPRKLAETRGALASGPDPRSRWIRRNGQDLCGKCANAEKD